MVRILVYGTRLGLSDSQVNSFEREVGFPLVAIFYLMITDRIWCLCTGQEQSELSGVIVEWFYVHQGVPGSRVCQPKHIRLHGILKNLS